MSRSFVKRSVSLIFFLRILKSRLLGGLLCIFPFEWLFLPVNGGTLGSNCGVSTSNRFDISSGNASRYCLS